MSHTFLFAGGGSGGHLFPGIAVAEELTRRDADCRVVFVGSNRDVERAILAESGFRQVVLPVERFDASVRRSFRSAGRLALATRESLRLMDEMRPDVVVGLGGFASVPAALAARLRRVPLILLEQNVMPGRATSLLCRLAETVCVSFDETRRLLPRRVRAIVTGNPIRRSIPTRARSRQMLLVLGGSQGAAGVNAAMTAAAGGLRRQLDGWRIVHQTGSRDVEAVRGAYERLHFEVEVREFFPDLCERYGAARLAVSRAGATTLAELAAVGCPAVLMPYPRAVRDHQTWNAEYYAARGAAVVVPEEGETLREQIGMLVANADRLEEMATAMRRLARWDAALQVADLLLPRAVAARAA